MEKQDLINNLPQKIPFGCWGGLSEPYQFDVGLNNLIFLNLTGLLDINSDINLLRVYAQEEHNSELLLDGDSMSSNTPEKQLERIEKSFQILDSKNIFIHERIKLRKEFFSFLNLHSFWGEGFSGIVILKAVEVGQISPMALQRDLVLPEKVKLVPAKMAYQIAFLLSHCMTENFMKVFDLYRILIMNEPLEKIDKNDDSLIMELSPSRKKRNTKAQIELALFKNPYSINKGDGLCFLCFDSTY